jgi:hypothetical protein
MLGSSCREKGHRGLKLCWIKCAISEEVEIDGLSMPQMQRDCRTAVQRKFGGQPTS